MLPEPRNKEVARRRTRLKRIAGVKYWRVADLASEMCVPRNRLTWWLMNRERLGFPDPIRHYARGPLDPPLWDEKGVEAALEWLRNYDPCPGGAPRGDRNGRWVDGTRRRYAEDGRVLR